MKRPKTLSAMFVSRVNEPGRYGDGRGSFGLSLLVKRMTNGRLSKSWAQRLIINGKPTNIGLGAFPIVTLAEARAKALENRRSLELGIDPRTGGVPTFSEAAEIVIRLHAPTWRDGAKSAGQWRASLRDYAFPVFGNKLVSEITAQDILAALKPNWNDKRETMRRVRQRIGAVTKWAVAQGYRADDPVPAVTAALPKNGIHRKSHTALEWQDVPAALAKIRESDAFPTTKLALEFIVLTACRSGEVRLAEWTEIDLDAATWTIPAERMKAGKEHRVPLSPAALATLEKAKAFADNRAGLVFPGATGRPMSDSTVSKLLRENEIGCVPHGFRSSFRSWCSATGKDRELAEMALAHTVRGVEGAYQRSDILERRRVLMAEWATRCTRNDSRTLPATA